MIIISKTGLTTESDTSDTLKQRLTQAIDVLRKVIHSALPDDWEPYDKWGNYTGIDLSNSGDVHWHGYEEGYRAAAQKVQQALDLLEAV